MRDIKQIFQIAKQNFTGWRKNPRIWMTFAPASSYNNMINTTYSILGEKML